MTSSPYSNQILRIAGNGVTDEEVEAFTPQLLSALATTPDSERALDNLVKWLEATLNRRLYFLTLISHTVGLKLLLKVFGTSQYLADLIIKNPEYFEFVANPGVRGGTRSATAYLREGKQIVDACARAELKLDALRRFKAREMLRIGVRDIAQLTDLPRTAREFSNLAEACVQIAFEMARTKEPIEASHPVTLPFCIIGMGKLGGRELNYSSDIDLMFVCGDDLPPEVTLQTGRKIETVFYLTRIGEAMIKILTEERQSGNVFRVDMRLRPEGRFGVLVRSISSFRAYYESWAEAWEFQALVKARPIAGDFTLGEVFLEMVSPYVYRRMIGEEFLDALRANKRNIERKCGAEGNTERNIKTGYGGIRDIEFLVQLFQTQYGGKIKRLRTPNTLAALHGLFLSGFFSEKLANKLSADYLILRRVEHTLQLFQNRQTHLLPPLDNREEIEKIAARLGFSTVEDFLTTLKFHRDHARQTLQERFYKIEKDSGEKPEVLTELLKAATLIRTPEPRLLALLSEIGVREPLSVYPALLTAMHGNDFGGMPPDTPEKFLQIAPELLTLAHNSPNPDAVLLGIEALATAVPNRAQLYASLAESRQLLPRLADLAVYAPALFSRLTQHLEWLETLMEEEEISLSLSPKAKLPEIGRYFLREQLRLVSLHVWGVLEGEDIPQSLTQIADTTLRALLGEIERDKSESRIALVALGKLGGSEPGYSSDWDLLAVYDDRGMNEKEREAVAHSANQTVEGLLKAGQELVKMRTGIELDFRLRPWGKKGALALSLKGYLRYFRTEAETWERHAALKARFVAGNERVGNRLVTLFHSVSFGGDWNAEADQKLHEMKSRIEAERLKPEDRTTDLKLGHGGLQDIEWIAQRLQLLNAKRFPALRVSNTLSALSALSSAGLLDHAEVETLRENYLLFSETRNALWLLGSHADTLSADPVILRTLARHLGYPDTLEMTTDLQSRMAHCRRIFNRKF